MTIEIVSQQTLSSSILAAAWLCLVFQKMPVAYFGILWLFLFVLLPGSRS